MSPRSFKALLNVVLAYKDMKLSDLLANALLLVIDQTCVALIVLLVLFKVYKFFEGVQLLVKFTLDLGLCSEEVQLVLILHRNIRIVAINPRDCLFDERGVCACYDIVKEHTHEVRISVLGHGLHIPHDKLNRALITLQVRFQRRSIKIKHIDELVL